MKKLLVLLVWFLSIISPFNHSNAFSEWEIAIAQDKWIQELSTEIHTLKESEKIIKEESKELQDKDKLLTFFKDDLTRSELRRIEKIITSFKFHRRYLENEFNSKAKNLEDVTETKEDIIEQRKALYKDLSPYIKQSEINNYLIYVKNDAESIQNKNNISVQIITNKEILSNKLTLIESKIKQNKETLNKELELAVIKKIDDKINSLKSNEKFANLDKKLKAKVIDKTIIKVKIRILNIENKSELSDRELQKLDLYKLLKSSLEKYKLWLLEQAAIIQGESIITK